MKTKDDRWAKQFGDFAENMVMYVLGQMKNMSVAIIDHVGADIIASRRDDVVKRYAISVKGRNFPENESKSYNFSQDNIDKLIETSKVFDMIPAVAFVFVDNMEGARKIRMFVITLEDMMNMCKDETPFLNFAKDGITFKYTEGKKVHNLTEIKANKKIDYTELEFTQLGNKADFGC